MTGPDTGPAGPVGPTGNGFVRLVWDTGDPADAGTVLAVELVDEALRPGPTVALPSAHPTAVVLPAPGRYLARGWFPDGRGATAQFPAAPVARTGDAPTVTLVVTAGAGPAAAPRAVMTGPPGIRVFRPPGRRPGPGLALSLLAYLDAGDLRSADVLAAEAAVRPGDDRFVDLALAYHAFRRGDPAFARQADLARRRLPDVPDTVLLQAWAALACPGGARTAQPLLVQAVGLGVPVVAAGVRLLADGLKVVEGLTAAEGGPHDLAVSRALRRTRAYQEAMLAEVLTAYTGSGPADPHSPGRTVIGRGRLTGPLPEQPDQRTGGSGMPRLRLRLAGPRAAGGTDRPPSVVMSDPEFGITATATGTDAYTVDLTVRLDRSGTPGELVVDILVTDQVRTVPAIVMLASRQDGAVTGTLIIRGLRDTVEIAVVGVRSVELLGAEDAAALAGSVRATGLAGRNAWRAHARTRAVDDPVRQAIGRGF